MLNPIGGAELILNPDGSIYHLHLRAEDVADTVIVVGDVGRVRNISKHFEKLDTERQNRDFLTHTGWYKGKRITVLSTGIGADNIDIVINELDAVVNIDLLQRTPKAEKRKLHIIRLGTSGGLQAGIPVDSFVVSGWGLGFDSLIHFYEAGKKVEDIPMSEAFIRFMKWPAELSRPYFVKGSELLMQVIGKDLYHGITATAPGFYGPQGRSLRLTPFDSGFIDKLTEFEYQGMRIVNFEMETSALYGLSRMLGHEAISVCVAVANRPKNEFSKDYRAAVDKLIILLLGRLTA
ncbi:MAG TPA: nucleoside phosphorylase [Bacteroidales bacterium]|nr:nucleoside phosphorylase [Bacteroidales bacterium]HSA43542.1 nucleoside phosphorylase [Bacteroidales bacterium]